MKIIVGLGNPGAQYASTPHSVGFESVDALAAEMGVSWETKKAFSCLFARGVFAGQSVLLVKPQTYMNLSGDTVAPVVQDQPATAGSGTKLVPAGRVSVHMAALAGSGPLLVTVTV
jgi:peptidyl-tRNA hydrolase